MTYKLTCFALPISHHRNKALKTEKNTKLNLKFCKCTSMKNKATDHTYMYNSKCTIND